ncbi:MAG: CotH kinase family protein [Bryobacteraceae bacterium]
MQGIHLKIDPQIWETFRTNCRKRTYYSSDFSAGLINARNIGIRSWSTDSTPEKPDLELRFDHFNPDQHIAGVTTMYLKANNGDASAMREGIAMNLFRGTGVPAPYQAPASSSDSTS